MAYEYVFDLGSSTAKLYRRLSTERLNYVASASWCLLEDSTSTIDTGKVLATLSALHQHCSGPACAIGTEVFRRREELSREVEGICSQLGITFRVISQSEEAKLIRTACNKSEVPKAFAIINVGGGSIQIVHPGTMNLSLLPFGVVDVARRFNLNSTPDDRYTCEAVSWVKSQLPSIGDSFAYTGGERTYLTQVGARIAADGTCTAIEFSRVASRLAAMPLSELKLESPFDPDWMRGAIASNCIVTALIEQCGCDAFLATDNNIAHGLLAEVVNK